MQTDCSKATEFPGHLIHQAVHWDNPELLLDLLQGDQKFFIDSTDSDGRTALHVAVYTGNMLCTKILLQHAADPDALGTIGHTSNGEEDDDDECSRIETALHIAVRMQNYSIASQLLASGANPNIAIIVVGSDDCERQTSTALKEACKNRDSSMVDLLIRYGATDNDCSALQIAAKNNDYHIMSKLLTLRAFPDPEYKISKKAFEIPGGSYSYKGSSAVGSVTFSSVFPTTAVMVNWHSLSCLSCVRKNWLVDAALAHNIKLKLNVQNQSVSLLAITRLDLSNNNLRSVPLCVFQMPSLRILSLSQNKLETLPETESHESSSTNRFMKKSHSYSSSLSSSNSSVTGSSVTWILPCLEEIYLQDNRLDSISSRLFELPSLKIVDLSNNKLRSLPSRFWNAPKLRDLNVSMNLLRDLPLTYSMVSTAIPSFTSTCTGSPLHTPTSGTPSRLHSSSSLESNEPLASSSSESKQSLRTFNNNSLHEDSAITTDTTTTATANASTNNANCFTPQPIVHQNLYGKQVMLTSNIPNINDDRNKDKICQLSILNLSHNAFSSIPHVLACVAVNLTRLNLSYNCLTSIGSVKLFPANLKHLDLSFNQLNSWSRVDVNDSIELACFACDACTSEAPTSPLKNNCPGKIYCMHRQHSRLDNLRSLVLANNQLNTLNLLAEDSFEGIQSFIRNLTSPDVQKNAVKGRCKILFPNLSMLDVSNNSIKEIPPLISELSNLSVLHLSGNTSITRLPPEMGLLSKLWNLNLRGCNLNEPLKSMIESKKYKTMDIIGYLKSILEDSKPYARMKLMVVGLQGIGKTSLLDQLRQEGYGSYRKRPPEHWAKRMGNKNVNLRTPKGVTLSTVGVDVCDWTYEKRVKGQQSFGPVTFRTWDFGGQKEYYSTHQYFLSKRSLYLVVWKMIDGDKAVEGIQQWLVNIQARAPNAPVIIVGTHYDQVKEFFPPFFSQELQQIIREKFINVIDADKRGLPRVVDSIEVSTKTRHNIKHLCNVIYDVVFGIRCPASKERLLEQKIPATYLALEEVVNHLATERIARARDPVLRADEYRKQVMDELLRRFKVQFRDVAELNQATAFLHDNGVLLHYEDATLKDLYFLDPQWLCDILAHVVTVREINPYAKNGIMSTDDLKHLFKGSCALSDAKSYIVNLLNKFEVALTWDSRTLLIPSLLPTEKSMISGAPGTDVRIPVRTRGWGLRINNQSSHEESEGDDASCLVKEDRPYKSVYRLLMMTFFPSGFWSRLMTRILGDDLIIEIIRSYFTFPKEVIRNMKSTHDLKADFVCWQTGLALKYLGETILRIKEIIPSVPNQPIDYLNPFANFQINFEGKWTDVDMRNTSILEIYLPNHCLKFERPDTPAFTIQPNQEYLTKLLSLAVDHIDTLLEDWYPSLGTRFVHTSEGKFLVTRLVPCNLCLMQLYTSKCSTGDVIAKAAESLEESTEFTPSNEMDMASFSTLLQNSKEYDCGYESACSSKFPSKDKADTSTEESEYCGMMKGEEAQIFCFLTEECILRASEQKRMRCPVHGDLSLKTLAPDTVFLDLGQHYLIKPCDIHRGKMLGRGAFGFVFRAHIKSKGSNTVTEVAMKMLQPVDPGHGARKSDNQAYKMASNKWEREPMQFACKAYTTARQELTILLSLRHPHVVPLVGVCTKPLALVLKLAPLGALDALIREYRRSGALMDAFVIFKTLLQVSKALEYLHQQHIIYRDLKSENVLVWKFPRPHEHVSMDVEVKLADYGISRSTLPTGTKGFGGTEGFMAPEIMKYNGEEEYTQKVDCFSFGMFIYELIALRLPFEGQESVKDHILDGGRPPLTVRETLYPSNLLDLMSLCWAESPKDRPTASQIVSMISAPEFVHQLDTICLTGGYAPLSSCVHPLGKLNDIWLTHVGKQCDIITVNSYACISYKSVKCVSDITVTASCCVPNFDGSHEIWLGDANAVVYIFDADDVTKARETHTLDPASPATAIKLITYSLRLQLVLLLTTNGKIYSYCRTSGTLSELQLQIDHSTCFTIAVVEEFSDLLVELWYGSTEGQMIIQEFSISGEEKGQKLVSHYPGDCKTSLMDRMDVFTIISSSKYCWTYLFPGCTMYHWSVDEKTILNKLDCSKLVPCSESLLSISIEDHLTATKCQVSTLTVLKDELFIGTNGGCLIVAESATLRPITVFRPHEGEIKILHAYESCDIIINSCTAAAAEKHHASSSHSGKKCSTSKERFLLTIGKGYRSLADRYVQLSPCIKDTNDQMYYATLWKSGYWL